MTSNAEYPEWKSFVADHGARASVHDLAFILGQTTADIAKVRNSGVCKHQAKKKRFGELFSLWHGRPPADEEWPAPRMIRSTGTYEWQEPETVLLASLVGQIGVKEIALVLTNRLRKKTGNQEAERGKQSVQMRISQIGMQTRDVVGGITAADAGREIGSYQIVCQAIRNKQLKTKRVGPLQVIPHAEWKAWKESRVFAPKDYVRLSTLRESLGIKSDKLSEFARMGYVATAIRCTPCGVNGPSTKFGTWFVSPEVADKLVADRRAGKPMPWHGKPLLDNLNISYKKWKKRQHPADCDTCRNIWGEKGAPKSFKDYVERYSPLTHGEKRHLTRLWTPGLTVAETVRYTDRSIHAVKRAIQNGTLVATTKGKRTYVSRTEATMWKSRGCPTGDGAKSWLALESASAQYLFTIRQLKRFIREGKLTTRTGTFGAEKGILYVSKHQCGELRKQIGFTEKDAARRAGVTVDRFRILLQGVNWRKADGIPLVTVQAVIKRLKSNEGFSLDEAAKDVGRSLAWVRARVDDGTVTVARAKWDRRRVYITKPMLERLRKVSKEGVKIHLGKDWLYISEAAHEAGVSTCTILKWADNLSRRQSSAGLRYHRESVRAKARTYWKTCRFKRAVPPAWLQAEINHGVNQ